MTSLILGRLVLIFGEGWPDQKGTWMMQQPLTWHIVLQPLAPLLIGLNPSYTTFGTISASMTAALTATASATGQPMYDQGRPPWISGTLEGITLVSWKILCNLCKYSWITLLVHAHTKTFSKYINQKGYNKTETTHGKLLARRIQVCCVYFCVITFLPLF